MGKLPEAWLAGPVAGCVPYLMPIAHSLTQVERDLQAAVADLTPEQVWSRPGGVASVGFHLRHVAGVLDRLLTYARGAGLDDDQLRALREEGLAGDPPEDAASLLRQACGAIERALEQVRATPSDVLLEPREVGRQRLPSDVLGLLYHAAEHAARHTGQIVTTATMLRGAPVGQ